MSRQKKLSEAVVKLLSQPRYQPLDKNQIAGKLKVASDHRRDLRKALRDLEEEGEIAKVRKNCWVLAQQVDLITGVLSFSHKGYAFLIPEKGGDDYYIAAEDTGVAMHQDLVTARLKIKSKGRYVKEDSKREAEVIRVLKRRRHTIVGTLDKAGSFWIVTPDDSRMVHDFYVPEPKTGDQAIANPGDKVVVEMTEWQNRHVNPEGVIIERLGKAGDPTIDFISIVKKYDLATEFDSLALAELAQFAHPEGDAPFPKGKDRLDLRKDFVVTIDPDDAKDFDDAISINKLVGGKVEVGIHIADVAHYVRVKSTLDKEAKSRGNSVYLPGKVIPMLPEELSNGLCSLKPKVDRLAFSAFITLSARGKMTKMRFAKSVIHSNHRLTYQEALTRLQRKPKDKLDKFLHKAWSVASLLRKNRFANGALDLEMPEVKVYCDKHGKVKKIAKMEHDISHQLIEEFMLLANEAVASALKNNQQPAIYRVHEKPDPSKLAEYRELLAIHGVKVGDLTKAGELQKALQKIAELPEAHSLRVGLLKSLKRAHYRPEPFGHFGLAKTNYTHFTSPIRRYSDLVVHRALERYVRKNKTRAVSGKALKDVSDHLSFTERNAAEAENELTKIKKLQYFADQLKRKKRHKYTALIMEVLNFGIVIELSDFLMTGLIHVSSMKNDFYQYDRRRGRFKGRRLMNQYAAGQKVLVEVDKVDMQKQLIDFKLVK
ncbi:MAG: ribonuclease R [Verrucomicrobiota bacterium]